jgi:hypothetical protein
MGGTRLTGAAQIPRRMTRLAKEPGLMGGTRPAEAAQNPTWLVEGRSEFGGG